MNGSAHQDVKRTTLRSVIKHISNIRSEVHTDGKKLGSKTNEKRPNRASPVLSVSTKYSSMCGPITSD